MPIKKNLPENAMDNAHNFEKGEKNPETGKKAEKQITWMKATDDHKFLEKQVLYQDQGITYKLFNNSDESYIHKPDNGLPPYLTIPEVVSNKDLKFFKVPRLGSYLAIKLEYKSCLSEKAMDDAMVQEEKYMAAVAEIEAEREEWEKAEETRRKEMEDAGTLDDFSHDPWPEKQAPEKPAFIQHT